MSKASKSEKKLKEEHKWYDKITEELLKRNKKIKLAIKYKIENIKK